MYTVTAGDSAEGEEFKMSTKERSWSLLRKEVAFDACNVFECSDSLPPNLSNFHHRSALFFPSEY